MTTQRYYKCNLCRDSIRPTEDATREGFGVHFMSASPRRDGGPWIAFKRPSDCENHVCLACAKGVHDELRKVIPVNTGAAE